MSIPLRIGIAGLGTVGAGVCRIIAETGEVLSRRACCPVVVTAVSARDKSRDRGIDLSAIRWEKNPLALAEAEDVDVVLELIGGEDGIAKTLIEQALGNGKHVVTANKAVMAHHGAALAELAELNGVALAYEAAIGGGIPVVKALREGLAANRFSRVLGILNGTGNYILTTMQRTGRDFAEVLLEAQAKGYAEADPTYDVDGIDTAHKLALLASLAFGNPVHIDAVECEGIREVTLTDIECAAKLGYRIKLLGIAALHGYNGSAALEQRVFPALVPMKAPLASVEDAYNAVQIEGEPIGRVFLEGPGAGAGPTASAVVADIMDIACNRRCLPFGIPAATQQPVPSLAADRAEDAFYLRLMVKDQPGVLAEITEALSKAGISMRRFLQEHDTNEEGAVPLVLTTHPVKDMAIQQALDAMEKLPYVTEKPHRIRMISA